MTSTPLTTDRPAEAVPRPPFRLTPSGSVTLLLGGACLLALLLQGLTGAGSIAPLDIGLAAGVVAALLGLDTWLAGRWGENPPAQAAVGAVIAHGLLVEAMTLLDGLTYTAILYLTLPFPAFFLLGRRAGLAVSVGLLGWFTFKFALFKPGWPADPTTMNTYVLFVIALLLIAAMAEVVGRERANRRRAERLLLELEASHAQLARYAGQVAELAASEERNRLARDIHDSLGHYLTVIGIQLEKALVVYDDAPAATLEAVRAAKRMTDGALADVRQSVGALRGDPAPFSLRAALDELLANLAGLPFSVELQLAGDEARYTRQQRQTLYRAAQEGLTNIQKHAHAQHVSLDLVLGEGEAVLTLSDDGQGIAGDPFKAGGFGLRGIRERLELVSGRLEIGAGAAGGTRLTVTIPRGRPFKETGSD